MVDSSVPGNGRNASPQAGQCFSAARRSEASTTTGRAERSLRPCPGLPGCCPRFLVLAGCDALAVSGTRGLLALGAVESLRQVADGGLERCHFRLEGRFPFHKPLVLRPPVVCLPPELDICLLRQHHCLLGKGRCAIPVHRRQLGGRGQLWLGTFHGLRYTRFFWQVPFFLKGQVG